MDRTALWIATIVTMATVLIVGWATSHAGILYRGNVCYRVNSAGLSDGNIFRLDIKRRGTLTTSEGRVAAWSSSPDSLFGQRKSGATPGPDGHRVGDRGGGEGRRGTHGPAAEFGWLGPVILGTRLYDFRALCHSRRVGGMLGPRHSAQ